MSQSMTIQQTMVPATIPRPALMMRQRSSSRWSRKDISLSTGSAVSMGGSSLLTALVVFPNGTDSDNGNLHSLVTHTGSRLQYSAGGLPELRVERESCAEFLHFLGDRSVHVGLADAGNDLVDQPADVLHLRFFH